MTESRPTFATNRPTSAPGESVAAALNALMAKPVETACVIPFEVWIATAFINPGGFRLIERSLGAAKKVRLLIGAEPEPDLQRVMRLTNEWNNPVAEALEGHQRTLEEDRNLLGFDLRTTAEAQAFVGWLRDADVEVRRLGQGFLHGKAYIVVRGNDERYGALAGSSNFTRAGLRENRELNIGVYEPKTLDEVIGWFEEIWAAAEPFDLASVYDARFAEHDPSLIYERMLWEWTGREIEEIDRYAGPEDSGLTDFQRDGAALARLILGRYGGVVIADGVGLGKTFTAGALIEEAQSARQRVLIVAPAALKGQWERFCADRFMVATVVSFDELANCRRLWPEQGTGDHLGREPDEFALVVVDEAHAFRNVSTRRAASLERLLAGSSDQRRKANPKRLVLLTATPVNNSLWDLYNLLAFFVRSDSTFAASGVPSLRGRFKEAAKVHPTSLDPALLFDVLAPVVVRRTRSYVKRYYGGDHIRVGDQDLPITFPATTVSGVDVALDDRTVGFIEEFTSALGAELDEDADLTEAARERRRHGYESLTLARYAPTSYLSDTEKFEELDDDGVEQTREREAQNAGLLRSLLLKRFESSPRAFAATCSTMANSNASFTKALESGYVVKGAILNEIAGLDNEEAVEALLAETGDEHKTLADLFDVASLLRDVQADEAILRGWSAWAEGIDPANDPKLAALVEQLAEIAGGSQDVDPNEPDASHVDRRKVIVFTYYADTAEWIHTWLQSATATDPRLAAYKGRVIKVDGNDHVGDRTDILLRFAPRTAGNPGDDPDGDYDILVTTDVLAEGVNLQQARHIINYDLPWNPMRLVQRHGRIDRIGSPHRAVTMRCFMPNAKLDRLLNLEALLRRKISQAARSIGTETEILPGSEVTDLDYVRSVIAKIRHGDSQVLADPTEGFSVEELRRQLRDAIYPEAARASDIRNLPWGSGSGFTTASGRPGFVFCAHVGDRPEPQFRFVDMTDPDTPIVTRDTLTCLRNAHPDGYPYRTQRHLDDDTHRLAYKAWAAAKEDILHAWNSHTTGPEVPKALRDASEHVKHHPAGMSASEIDSLQARLEDCYPDRIARQFREVLRSQTEPETITREISDLADRLNLSVPTPPEPLPPANGNEIHLICWQARTLDCHPPEGQPCI